MVPTAILGITSDQFYLKGLKTQNLFYINMAKQLFPFNKDILVGPAQFYFRYKIANKDALNIYKETLKYDPYSVQFLGVYAQLEYLIGNKNEALIAKQKLEKIAPNSNALKRINVMMKGLK